MTFFVGVGVARMMSAASDAMPISAMRRLFSSIRAARAASNAFAVSVVVNMMMCSRRVLWIATAQSAFAQTRILAGK
jgi:hypothetical protein